MPTYEYRCKDCGEHLEVVQSFTDDALTECPNCGGALRKVFGNIGVTFKGSGFYRNDSRSSSKPAAKKESSESSASSDTSDKTAKAEKSEKSETSTSKTDSSSSNGSDSSTSSSSGSKSEAKSA